MRVALINSNIVVNVIEADLAFIAFIQAEADYSDIVDVTSVVPAPGVGWTYIGGVFSAPVSPPAMLSAQDSSAMLSAQDSPVLTLPQLRARFTQPEKTALELASADVPTDPQPTREQAATLRAQAYDDTVAGSVDTSSPEFRNRMLNLETIGVLAVGRATEVLDNLAFTTVSLTYEAGPEDLMYNGTPLPKTGPGGVSGQLMEFDLSSLVPVGKTAINVLEIDSNITGTIVLTPQLSVMFNLGRPVIQAEDTQGASSFTLNNVKIAYRVVKQ